MTNKETLNFALTLFTTCSVFRKSRMLGMVDVNSTLA